MSYEYVSKTESKPFSLFCSQKMNELKQSLQEFGIICTVYGIGSYAKNMVTRNGKAPYDLDYNLEIIKQLPTKYSDLEKFKNLVRSEMDKKLRNTGFSCGKDSKSVITYILHLPNKTHMKFSFDIGIVSRNKNGNLQRLIHNKNKNSFTWNEAKDSKGIENCAKILKSHGHAEEIKAVYLKKKNDYLSKNQKENHPSFNVYIETVNELYRKYLRQSGKTKECFSKKLNHRLTEMRKLVGDINNLTLENAKNKLLILVQNKYIPNLQYSNPKKPIEYSEDGKPIWEVFCKVAGYEQYWTCKRSSKKAASQAAAFCVLKYTILCYKQPKQLFLVKDCRGSCEAINRQWNHEKPDRLPTTGGNVLKKSYSSCYSR